jgi:hypothetical protein
MRILEEIYNQCNVYLNLYFSIFLNNNNINRYVDQYVFVGGSRWRSWLRHAKCQKVVVSISDGVIGIFHRLNPSGRTVALGSTHPLKGLLSEG